MYFLIAEVVLIIIARSMSGSWRTTLVLPWVVLLTPFLVGAGLANLSLIPSLVTPWDTRMYLVVYLAALGLGLGSITTAHIRNPLMVTANTIHWDSRMIRNVLLLATLLALAGCILEFSMAKEIPLFSSDPDRARGEVARYGYIHIFTALSQSIVPVGVLILASGQLIKKKIKLFMRLIILINILALFMWCSRGKLFFPILTSCIIIYFMDKSFFKLKKIAVVFIVFFIIVGGIKLFRGYVKYGDSFTEKRHSLVSTSDDSSLLNKVILGSSASLYLTITANYEILNKYTKLVPNAADYSMGRMIAGYLFPYLPGREYVENDFQNKILKKNKEEATLTSTIAGVPFLEFGMPGVFIICFLVGFVYRMAWLNLCYKGTPSYIFIYSFLIAWAPLVAYSFVYVKISFIWGMSTSLMMIFLCGCSLRGCSLYCKPGRVYFGKNYINYQS